MRLEKRFLLIALAVLGLASCSQKGQRQIRLTSEADIAGLRVAAVAGSCYDMELSSREDIELQLFTSAPNALQALLNNKVDVLLDDETIFNAAVRREQGIKIALRQERKFPTALAFRKDEPELAEACNIAQRRMIADGTMDRLKDFWLNDKYLDAQEFTHIPAETEGEPIRVATCCAMAPISFQVGTDWFGIEMDILRETAKELHRPLEIGLFNVAAGIMAMGSGVVDVLSGGVFVTPEREEQFLFAEPYHDFHGAYYVIDREAQEKRSRFIPWLKNSFRNNLIVEDRWKHITEGLWVTILISILSILLGSILGIGLYAMAHSRHAWLRSAAGVYGWFIAGIPQLVLLLILFYVIFAHSGVSPILVAVIAFAMTFAAGASHIYETSLSAIPRGQTEAGLALGFTKVQTFFHIVFPQALRRGLPLFSSQCIGLLKGTAIVGYIAIQDLTHAGDIIRSRTFDALVPLLVVTVIYFLLAWLLGRLLKLALPKKNVL